MGEGQPRRAERVLSELYSLLARDPDPHSGRLWAYVYEHGDHRVRQVAEEAYIASLWRNMLDPLTFPSVQVMEKEVVAAVARLFNAPSGAAGSFTSGGTESNFTALLAAREKHYKARGRASAVKIVAPITVHPSVAKAAWILGMKLELTPIGEDRAALVDAIVDSVDGSTAAVVLSAPNYPYGVFDPVREVAEALEERGVWLHVDACLGFAAPFAKRLGEPIPDFDLGVEGVTSISVDLHKYAYAPRGSSVVLYRSRGDRENAIFTYSRWPGYPLVNQVFLSSRTLGPLAASWAMLRLLGEEGYTRLTERALWAKKRLVEGMKELGFRLEGKPPYLVLAFSSEEVDVVSFAEAMARRGWVLQVQPGSKEHGLPVTLHFTVTPAHAFVVDEFLGDASEAVGEAGPPKSIEETPLYALLSELKPGAPGLEDIAEALASTAGESGGGLAELARIIHGLDPSVVEELLRKAANALL